MTDPLAVRDFRAPDAPVVARLVTESVRGQWIYTPDRFEETRTPDHVRLVAERGGEVVATAALSPFGAGASDALRLDLAGEAEAFSALYLAALPRVPAPCRRLLGVTREDFPPMAFFHAAGFRNAWQSWGAHLDLTAFDPARFDAREERLFLAGYEVEPLSPDAPDADWAALHALHEEGLDDAPRNPTTTAERLSAADLRGLARHEESVFVARFRGVPVAFTRLTRRAGEGEVESEQTVTSRVHRGRGVATVTKARALGWARAEGFRKAGTGGTVLNVGMLRVNARLGYVAERMWVTWERVWPVAVSAGAPGGEGLL